MAIQLPVSAALNVVATTSADQPQWDAFVESHPESRFCQLWGYRQVLESTYGYHTAYYKLMLDDKIVGVFPSIVVRRGRGRLVSQPFQEYGGPLLSGVPANGYEQLAERLVGIATANGCSTLEFRGGIGCEPLAESSHCVRHPLHQFAELALEDKDILWRKSLTNEARKGITKSQESGLKADIRLGTAAVSGKFFKMYLDSMKRLGVPPHSFDFFTNCARYLGDNLVGSWVQHQGQDIAVLIGIISGNRIQAYITASDPAFWSMRPNDLAHWEMIQWAFVSGRKTFDFGSARYPGQVHYKKKWGAKFHDYAYYLLGQPASPELQAIQTVQTSSKSMTRAAKIWENFVPIPLTRILGPSIRKYLTK